VHRRTCRISRIATGVKKKADHVALFEDPSLYRGVVFIGLFLLAGLFQPPAPNREFEALQAHFERTVTARSDALFSGIRQRPVVRRPRITAPNA
jgi:hypothetical protein